MKQQKDVEVLKKVSLYRCLGLSVPKIKNVLESKEVLRGIIYQRTLELEREKIKQELLKQVLEGTEIEEQLKAFHEIIEFFDNASDLELSVELQNFLDEYMESYSSEDKIEKINAIIRGKEDAMQDIDEFVKSNKEILDEYHKFKQTDEYKNSYSYQLMEVLKQFCASSGYYEVFIPAMRRLSPTYDAYYVQMLKANEQFMKNYPEYC